MNTWTLAASVASIVSLIFHLSGKGSGLRQFTLPTTTALVGFTLGRNRSDVEQASSLLLQDPHLLFMLVVMMLLFALTMYLVEATKPEAKISFIFLVFLATIAVPQLIKSYNDIAPMVATQDYLMLARVKESDGNTEDAIKYLRIYSKRVERADLQKQIDERIENLRKQQYKRESTTKIKLKDN
jgi:phosphoglycerol transferase MdoB-like AlkP superfamily enzyme